MKKKTIVTEFHRVIRWKKHLKAYNKKRKAKKDRLRRIFKQDELSSDRLKSEQFKFEGARLLNELKVLNPHTRHATKREIKKRKVNFPIKGSFDIYEDPNSVFRTISTFRQLALNPNIDVIYTIHDRANTCMSSEALLGIVAAEVSEYRGQVKCPVKMHGHMKQSTSDKVLIGEVGIVGELNNAEIHGGVGIIKQNVFLFKSDNKLFESASLSAEDYKNETAIGCIKQLSKGLARFELRLMDGVEDELAMSLGEILDNAQEHCHRTSPSWYVRSFLNTDDSCLRYFELMVMNLGHSIAQTFEMLPDTSAAKADAMSYARRHSNLFTTEELLTVAALQGNVSSKKDEDMTRGQGTIRLIETFETISKEFVELRGSGDTKKNCTPIMNIISGKTVITFNGKYKSKIVINEDGSEDVHIPFNQEETLKLPPDSTSISSMANTYFPGVMINIRIPLNGRTKTLKGNSQGINKYV
ncbi:hypothetical protein [Vibrio rarus]|uniref:hypothetical protein n=1 Tax=Vibrio rarus TaxID=413403 RepID=UPI0021C28F00|nr:hypothetical protein [Vibrio rarus]